MASRLSGVGHASEGGGAYDGCKSAAGAETSKRPTAPLCANAEVNPCVTVSSINLLDDRQKQLRGQAGKADKVQKSSSVLSSWRQNDDEDKSHLDLLAKLAHWNEYIGSKARSWAEVPADRCVDLVVRSRTFEIVCLLVILLNIGFVVQSTNYEMNQLSDYDDWFALVDLSFVAFYVIEVLLRLLSYRLSFLFGSDMYWNILDLSLVVGSILNLVVLSSSPSLGWVRFLRILRVLKVVRVLRLLHGLGLEDLWLMSKCIVGSAKTFLWCVIILIFIQFVFAVYFVQALSTHLITVAEQGVTVDSWTVDSVTFWFGSVQNAMMSLLMTTTGGADWREVYEVVRIAGWVPCIFFLFYILFFAISVWNVVTSTFVDKALKLAQSSDEAVLLETRMKDLEDTKELAALFRKMDKDSSNTLTFEEFSEFVHRPEFEAFLRARGIDIREAKSFFKMLNAADVSQDEVDIDTLVSGCLRLRGHASSIDLHTVRYELKAVHRMQQVILRHVAAHPACLGEQSHDKSPRGKIHRSKSPRARSAYGNGGAPCACPASPISSSRLGQ